MKSIKQSTKRKKIPKKINRLYVGLSAYRYTFAFTVITAGIITISGSPFVTSVLTCVLSMITLYEMTGNFRVTQNRANIIVTVIFIAFTSFFGTALYELEVFPMIIGVCALELFICKGNDDELYKDVMFPAAISLVIAILMYSATLLQYMEKGIYCIIAVAVCVLAATAYDAVSGYRAYDRYILRNEYCFVSIRNMSIGALTGFAAILLYGVIIKAAGLVDIRSTAEYVFYSLLISCSVQFGRMFTETLKKPLERRTFGRLSDSGISVLENIGGYIISMPISFMFLETTNMFSQLTV